jgi:hypothetical protein
MVSSLPRREGDGFLPDGIDGAKNGAIVRDREPAAKRMLQHGSTRDTLG